MKHTVKCRSLKYYGGKQAQGKAVWIADQLPWTKRSSYIEPFCGMASVLLARAPVSCELINDLDERVVNWWRVVRDESQEFARLLTLTPISRTEHSWAQVAVSDISLPPIRRALAFHILAAQSIAQNSEGFGSNWARTFSSRIGSVHATWNLSRIEPLADRLRKVQLENRCAMSILERIVDYEDMVIYCDPPYRTCDTRAYRHGADSVNVEKMTELLLACRGKVAVSGARDEWDHLDWRREERQFLRAHILGERAGKKFKETLWMNYGKERENDNGLGL